MMPTTTKKPKPDPIHMDEEIYWQRKSTSSKKTNSFRIKRSDSLVVERLKNKNVSEVPPPPQPSQSQSQQYSTTSTASVCQHRHHGSSPMIVRARTRSTSRPRLSRSRSLSRSKIVVPDCELHNSDRSLGDFVTDYEEEIHVWKHRRGKRPSPAHQVLVQPSDQHEQHHTSSSDSKSLSSKSFHCSEGSIQSSSSSISSSGGQVAVATRKAHAGRTTKLRQQLREQQKAEKPKRNHSATKGTKSLKAHQITRSHSQNLTPRKSSSRRLIICNDSSTDKTPMHCISSPTTAEKRCSTSPRRIISSTRGTSARSLVRNKSKDEQEISQTDVFRYVHRHQCSMDEYKRQPSITHLGTFMASRSGPEGGDNKKKEDLARNLPKCINQASPFQHQAMDETWHDDNLMDDFSTIHSRKKTSPEELDMQDVINTLKNMSVEKTQEGTSRVQTYSEGEQEEQDLCTVKKRTVKADDSFQSLDWKDFPSTCKSNNMKTGKKGERCDSSSATCTTSATSGLTDNFQSQSLSITLDDMPCSIIDLDTGSVGHDSLQNSAGDLMVDPFGVANGGGSDETEIYRQSILDQDGRRGIYSGTVSTSSGMPSGDGMMEYIDDDEVFIGRFVEGRWSGYGTWKCLKTQEEHTGFFEDHVRHGPGTTKRPGGLVFEGMYCKGVKVEGKMTYADQSTYVGGFENGVRSGRGTYTFANGAVFIGHFSRDKMTSGVLTYPERYRRHIADGRVVREGTWKNGQYVS